MRAAASQACSLLKVLSNPDRLPLLCQLAQGPLCVSELERTWKFSSIAFPSGEAMAVMEVLYPQYCKKPNGATS
jgi:hypothetical protein